MTAALPACRFADKPDEVIENKFIFEISGKLTRPPNLQ